MFISFSNTHFLISLLIFTEQTPPNLAVEALLVAEGVLDLGDAAGRGAGEVVVAHGDGGAAGHVNHVVVEDLCFF